LKNHPISSDDQLNYVIQAYKERRKLIKERLREFSEIMPSDYFYELAYCLLTPQSSAAHADMVVTALCSAGFHKKKMDPEPMLRRKECYIRFHRNKSRYLIMMKDQFDVIAQKLKEPASAFDLREWIVENVVGIGYKEATHFLRNIGKNEGLAILDRHILRNLKRLKVIRSVPKSISRKNYLQIEKRFSKFAEEVNIDLDELDLVFWSMETGEILK
jgi:N-glycosylase/DNA lyase